MNNLLVAGTLAVVASLGACGGDNTAVPQQAGAGQGELAELPDELPEFASLDAKDATVSSSDGQKSVEVIYDTALPAEEALAVYARRLRDNGWEVVDAESGSTIRLNGFDATGTMEVVDDNQVRLEINHQG